MNVISSKANTKRIGMAIRLALDLGLHIDATPYVQKGQMSSEEAQTRSVAFWGCFVADQ